MNCRSDSESPCGQHSFFKGFFYSGECVVFLDFVYIVKFVDLVELVDTFEIV